MMIIENKFDIGQEVYLVTDENQNKKLVTGLRVCPKGAIIYYLSQNAVISEHYDFEISNEKNIVIN